MKSACMRGTALMAFVLIQGCAIGYNSVLFATRSNMGVDADTAPPNFEVAISRQEGVIEPTFEGGQTLPVMASFSSKATSIGNFFWGVGSTFSTGEAAFTMSHLYNDPTPADTTKIPYERVTLSKDPVTKLPFGVNVDYLEAGDVKPVLFGTDTIFGLKVKWSGQTAQYPSSVNIGFKRKEAALAPVALGPNRIQDPNNPNNAINKPREVDIPSLLATIDTDVAVPGTKAELTYLQYFATGTAASNLARQHAVREAMLKRADPGQDLQAQKAEEGKALRDANRKLIKQVAGLFRNAAAAKKATIVAKAKELALVDESVATDPAFLKGLGEHSDAPPPITAKLAELANVASAP